MARMDCSTYVIREWTLPVDGESEVGVLDGLLDKMLHEVFSFVFSDQVVCGLEELLLIVSKG